MTSTILAFDDIHTAVGRPLGPSDWLEITQERVDTFAKATDDAQWIHTDPERAKTGPFGTTVAHGFLTLSLLIPLWTEVFDVADVSSKVNYGLDRVRFTAPVPVGSRLRLAAEITEASEVKGGVQLTVAATIELEGSERPAVVAVFLNRFYR